MRARLARGRGQGMGRPRPGQEKAEKRGTGSCHLDGCRTSVGLTCLSPFFSAPREQTSDARRPARDPELDGRQRHPPAHSQPTHPSRWCLHARRGCRHGEVPPDPLTPLSRSADVKSPTPALPGAAPGGPREEETTLTTEYGVAAGRLRPAGVGPLAPAATNTTEQGRALNRRVELVKQ
jgi:hypothetical protein